MPAARPLPGSGRPLQEDTMPSTPRDARQTPAARPDAGLPKFPDFEPTGQLTGEPDLDRSSGRAEIIDEEPDLTTSPHTLGTESLGTASDVDEGDAIADVEPSLVDQELLTDPMAASGGPDDNVDPVSEGDEVYVPPTDPVITAGDHGETRVLGGFSPEADVGHRPLRSSDGQIGDEALADAVRSALRHDATTTDLRVDVAVEDGVVRLFGTVADLEDVDNAEAVAGRVPGVVDVVEELQVASV